MGGEHKEDGRTARDVAEADVERIKGFFKGYTVRPDSWSLAEVNGLPAARHAADYIDEEQAKVEYRAYILGRSAVYWFVFRVDKDRFEAMRPQFDAVIQGLQAPRPTATQRAAASRAAAAQPGDREQLERLAQEAFDRKQYAAAEKHLQKLVVLDPMGNARARLQEAAVLAHPERYEGLDLSSPEAVVRGFMQAAVAGDAAKAMAYVVPYGVDCEDIQSILMGSNESPSARMLREMFAALDPKKPVEGVTIGDQRSGTAVAKWRVRFGKPWTVREKGQEMTFQPGQTFELDGDLKRVAGRWFIDGI